MELPQYAEYGKILEMNPFAAWQAGQQMDLARTFQQEKLAQEQERAKSAQLANIFAEQQNPLLLEQQRQQNLERKYGMSAKRIAGEIAEETAPQQKQLALRNAILNLKQADITEMERKARMMAYDPDPNVRAQGVELMKLTPEFVKLREEEAGKMAREKEQQRGATQRTGMTITSQEKRAAALRAGKGGGTLADRLAAAKTAFHKANIYDGEAIRAEEADDPERAQYYRERAAEARQEDIRARQAAAEVAAGRDIDLPALEAGELRRRRDLAQGQTPPASVVRKPATQAPALPPGWTLK